MPAYNYIAIGADGREKKGVIEADGERQVRQRLRNQALTPLEIWPVKGGRKAKAGKAKTRITFGRRSMKIADLSLVTRQMATLLAAGLPVEEMLSAVAEQTEKSSIKSILIGVRSKVMEGYTLANGMSDFPRAFPDLYRSTVLAGEQSGHLDQVLIRLADYIEKQYQMQQKIKQALIYPTLMTLISIGIVIFLLIFVVPRIVDVFSQTKQTLPISTTILLAISAFTKKYGIYLLIIIVTAYLIFLRSLKNEGFRRRFHLFLQKIPVLGKNFKTVNSARFLRTFGILFAASVPVLEAMKVSADLIKLLPMREAVLASINKVREGTSINVALRQTGYFSPMSIHMMASGEASGQLETMLTRVADSQDQDVAMLIESSLSLFEPMLIIVMGAIVLFIVLAVMLPIFQLDTIAGQN